MSPPKPSLDKLRREIDQIDDDLHDLLMRRSSLVEEIRRLKGDDGGYLRPAREALILRRLVARHRGHFPKTALVRIWREIMASLVRLQGPFTIAVFAAEGYPGYWDVARDHFGASTPITGYTTVGQVVRAVGERTASVGVLPWPHQSSPDPWWRHLLSDDPDRVRIIARLPFAHEGGGRAAKIDAVAIARMPQEPTGRDRSLLVIETAGEISRSRFTAALNEAGLEPRVISDWKDGAHPQAWLYLVEVDEFVAPDDPRLAQLTKKGDGPVTRAVQVGGYAVPLSAAELAAAGEESDE